jgi:hypothetical protein
MISSGIWTRACRGIRLSPVVVIGVTLALPCEAQPQGAPEEYPRIPRLSAPVVVDGVVDETEWQEGLLITLPWEVSPGDNRPAIVRTECRVGYDSRAVYMGCIAYDPNPSAIRAHLTDRDSAWRDDYIGLMLDTFNDSLRAFGFFVNPLGVQMDIIRNDLGAGDEHDESWDAIWKSNGRITEEGYEIELAVPFTSLRFQSTDGPQIWAGFITRNYPRSVRRQLGSSQIDRNLNCFLCQGVKVIGFEGVKPGKNLDISPTLTARRIDEREGIPDGRFRVSDEGAELGLTVLWGITPNLTFAGTINPDFSQVEADAARLDVNRRFAIFFEEKRPFFLEAADYFETLFNVVHTRSVADPDWGAKLTGKAGPGAIGTFVAGDAITNILIPGSERSFGTMIDDSSIAGVARYRRDIGLSSYMGALYTGREGTDYSNHVVGIDGLFRFTDHDSINFQVLGSQTEYPEAIAAVFKQPSGSFRDAAYRVGYRHETRDLWLGASYRDVGEGFRADLGFMPQVDYREANVAGQRSWWGDRDEWYTRIRLGGRYHFEENQRGGLLFRGGHVWTGFEGPLQSEADYTVSVRTRGYQGVEFDEQTHNLWARVRPSGLIDFGLSLHYGDDIDYAHVRPGTQFSWEPWVTLRIGRHLEFNFSHDSERLDVEGGRLFEVELSELKVVYQFSARTFVRAILQYEDLRRNPQLYDRVVASKREDLFTQLLFSYKINPKTVLFLGYSDNHLGTDSFSVTQLDRTVFFKLGYAWVF